MKKQKKEDADPGPEAACNIPFYFTNPGEANALFAGIFLKNLNRAAEKFHVKADSRDLVVRISGEKEEDCRRFKSFLEELRECAARNGGNVEGRDFDMILSASLAGKGSLLQEFYVHRIKVGPRKKDILPRTANQLAYAKCIREKDMIFGIGPAGTGKTYLAMAFAVSELLAGNFSRIILTRPAVEAGENLGFLPGKLEDKINPYLRPLYDALYDMLDFEEANSLLEKGIIEVAPLAFMRGRTLSDAFIILDEAQNTTNEQMLMLLTRLGYRSKCVIAGDPTQVDLPMKRSSGLPAALRNLQNLPDIAICRFGSEDVLRHTLVEKIVEAYRAAEEENNSRGEAGNE